MKTCTKCGYPQDESAFSRSKANADGFYTQCKTCVKEYAQSDIGKSKNRENCRRWYKSHATTARKYERNYYHNNKDYYKNYYLKRKYDFTLEQYDFCIQIQGNRCAMCDSPEPGMGRKRFSVDHDHQTGKVRGLLCGRCNLLLGHSKDDVTLLQKGIDYLNQSKIETGVKFI